MLALKTEVQSLQQALNDRDAELAQTQQHDHAQVAQLQAAHEDLANKLRVAQDALQVKHCRMLRHLKTLISCQLTHNNLQLLLAELVVFQDRLYVFQAAECRVTELAQQAADLQEDMEALQDSKVIGLLIYIRTCTLAMQPTLLPLHLPAVAASPSGYLQTCV